MARPKGTPNTVYKAEAFKVAKTSLKYLTYDELEVIVEMANQFKKEKLDGEALRLIKEKEEIEQKLKNLKSND